MSGTTPDPPAISSSGPPSLTVQLKCPPIGPRTSNWSPARTSSARYGETSPSSITSIVSCSVAASGAEAIDCRALGLVAVLRGQAHVDVLAGAMPGHSGTSSATRLIAVSSMTCATVAVRHTTRGPGVSRSSTAAPATGPRSCGTPRPPRSQVRHRGSASAAGPISHSPEIQMRHEQAHGAAVLGGQGLTVIRVNHPRAPAA